MRTEKFTKNFFATLAIQSAVAAAYAGVNSGMSRNEWCLIMALYPVFSLAIQQAVEHAVEYRDSAVEILLAAWHKILYFDYMGAAKHAAIAVAKGIVAVGNLTVNLTVGVARFLAWSIRLTARIVGRMWSAIRKLEIPRRTRETYSMAVVTANTGIQVVRDIHIPARLATYTENVMILAVEAAILLQYGIYRMRVAAASKVKIGGIKR